MIHRPGIPRKREKGQPEGSAIKSKTRKPRVANTDRKTCYAAGRNNSNPTPFEASASDDEWELLLVNSSHYCFILWLIARSFRAPPHRRGEAIGSDNCKSLLSLPPKRLKCPNQDYPDLLKSSKKKMNC